MTALSDRKEKIVIEIFCGGNPVNVEDIFIHWNNEVSINNYKDIKSLTGLFVALLDNEEMQQTLDEAKEILKLKNK